MYRRHITYGFILIFILFTGLISYSQSAITYYEKGLKQMKKQDWQGAVSSFTKAIQIDPHENISKRSYGVQFIEYFPNRELGIAYYHLGKYIEANQWLKKSLDYEKTDRANSYMNLLEGKLLAAESTSNIPMERETQPESEQKTKKETKPLQDLMFPITEKSEEEEIVAKSYTPPKITWINPQERAIQTKDQRISLSAYVYSQSSVESITLFHNSKAYSVPKTSLMSPTNYQNGDLIINEKLDLLPGTNSVYFVVKNKLDQVKSDVLLIDFLQEVEKEKRLALIIGNGNYLHSGYLANPENDARAMSNALKELDFDVMKYENADLIRMKKAMEEYGERLKNYDVGLFFYAGHGVQVDGINYLIPVDAVLKNENEVEYDCVNTGRILAKMESAGNKTNIIMLDACRDNPFARSWHRSAQTRGLAFMNAPTGSLIAYATAPGSTASDGTGKNGLYTSALLEEMKAENVTILQMFQNVRKKVMEKSNNSQIPWESTSLTGDFYFLKTE